MALDRTHMAALNMLLAVAECIRDLDRPVPSGELYANLMGHMTLDTYQSIVRILKEGGFITESNFLLTWVGPIGPSMDANAFVVAMAEHQRARAEGRQV